VDQLIFVEHGEVETQAEGIGECALARARCAAYQDPKRPSIRHVSNVPVSIRANSGTLFQWDKDL
jgi:hypothetical protein